jgi:IS5 family transposase
MFRRINKSLKEAGYIKEVFTFIDASAIKSRVDVGKARDKDRWLSKVRMPYEGVFSCMSHTARYRGLVKIQFQAFMQALAYNLKRLVKIKAPPIDLVVC